MTDHRVTDERIEALLRQQPPDEPAFVPHGTILVPKVGRVAASRPLGGASSPGLWAVAVGALVVAVVGWQSLTTRHEPSSSAGEPTPGESTTQASPLPQGVIPWLDQAYVAPTPEPTASVEALQLCRADDLFLVAAGWEGATGSMAGTAELVNAWSDCRIEKLRDASLLDANGHVVAQATFLVNLESDARNRIGIAEGGAASATVVWSNWCGGAPPLPLTLSVTLRLDTDSGPQDAVLTAPVRPSDAGVSGQTPRCDAPGGSSTISIRPFDPVIGQATTETPVACQSADVDGFAGVGGAAAGTYFTPLVLLNSSGLDCVLPSEPTIELRDAHHAVLAATQRSDPTPTPLLVPSGATVRTMIGMADWCLPPPAEPLSLDVVIDGTPLPLAEPAGVTPGYGYCNSAPATPPPDFFLADPFDHPEVGPIPAPPDPGDTLPFDAVVSIPPGVHGPGDTLEYTVALTNRSPYDKPINLAAFCPSYSQTLGLPDGRPPLQSRFVLNCGPAGILAGGETRTFEMRLDIPVDATPGTATLSWQLGFAGTGDKVSFAIGG